MRLPTPAEVLTPGRPLGAHSAAPEKCPRLCCPSAGAASSPRICRSPKLPLLRPSPPEWHGSSLQAAAVRLARTRAPNCHLRPVAPPVHVFVYLSRTNTLLTSLNGVGAYTRDSCRLHGAAGKGIGRGVSRVGRVSDPRQRARGVTTHQAHLATQTQSVPKQRSKGMCELGPIPLSTTHDHFKDSPPQRSCAI